MQLTDILSLEKWKELEKKINKKFKLDTSVFDTNGIRITDYREWANRLCPVIKANDKGQSFICAVAHMNLAVIAKRTRKSLIEECDAGLAKPVVPIFVGDEFIGTICGCGALLEGSEVDAYLINKITGIDEEEVIRLSADIETINISKAESLIEYMQAKIRQIVNNFESRGK